MRPSSCLLPVLLAAAAAHAQNHDAAPTGSSAEDLTLGNFFSAGWDEPWQHRHRETRDVALLRVTTNFLEREARVDDVFTKADHNPKLQATHLLNGLIAYAISRRLMLEVVSNYQWNVPPNGASPVSGAGGGALLRVQLIETEGASYSAQARISPANKGLGATQASLTYGIAGWHAVADKLGLYWSATLENLLGNHKAGARENDLQYAAALAYNVAAPLFLFVEGAGTTDLDGNSAAPTVISATPGVRWFYLPKQSLTLGADIPLTANAPFSYAGRATWIMNF